MIGIDVEQIAIEDRQRETRHHSGNRTAKVGLLRMKPKVSKPKPTRRHGNAAKATLVPRSRARRAKTETASVRSTALTALRENLHRNFELAELRNRVARLESANNRLTSSLARSNDLSHNLPVGDLILDERGVILKANRQASRLFGFTYGVDPGIPFHQFVQKDQIADFNEQQHQSRRSREPISTELTLVLPGARSRAIELITVPVGFVPGRVADKLRAILIDITQRDASRQALRSTHQNYRALIDSIHGIVWEADPATMDVLFVSQSAERLLGYPTATWFNPGFWPNHIYVGDRDRVLLEMAKACAVGDGHYTIDYRVLDAQRKCLWFRDTLTIFTHAGRRRLLGVAVDITDRKELEERLGDAQAQLEQRVQERTAQLRTTVAELESFAYSLSHDLRAPLRAVEGYAQIVLQSADDRLRPGEKAMLERIRSSSKRLDGLVQDILKYSRVSREPVELHAVNVEQLVQGIVNDYPGFQPPNANIEVKSPLPEVRANEAFLTQCVSNLLTNAVKFVKPGAHAKVCVWSEQMGDHVRLWFEDNGIGIDPEAHRRIFGIFQRMHSKEEYEGTGIGLAVVKKAAERMGGRVGLESALGKGSKFWVELLRA